MSESYLTSVWQRDFIEVDDREIWETGGELPPAYAVSGKLDIDTAPMIKAPLRDLRSAIVRNVICMCGVQCLKTLIGELWLRWLIRNDPGPTQWLQPTDQEAKEHAKERFIPLIENDPDVARFFTGSRHDKTSAFLKFIHMWLRMEGAETDANLQRKSIKNQMRSEVWQRDYWTPGKLKEADSRLTQFVHNSKTYTESQPGYDAELAGEFPIDDMHAEYLKGNQNQWTFPCQACGKFQPYFWSVFRADGSRAGVRWDTTERTTRKTDSLDPNERYRWPELVQTIRIECVYCGERHYDNSMLRRRMGANGKHIPARPDADPATTSYAWNQFAMVNLSWFETKIGGVKNFLMAQAQAKQGNDKPLREFFQKVCNEPYNPRKHGVFHKPDTITIESSPEQAEIVEHGGIKFPHRTMMVDVQADVYWVLVTYFSETGDALIVHAEECVSWGDVAAIQPRFKVPDQNVGVDISHRGKEVVRECCRHGHIETKAGGKREFVCWHAFRGSDSSEFRYEIKKGQFIPLFYSWPPEWGDPCDGLKIADPRRKELHGRFCPIISWSNPSIKDVALSRLRGKAEAVRDFVLAGDWNDEYARQRDSQKKVVADRKYGTGPWKFIKKHPDDHLNDCYCMALTLATMRKWLLPVASKQEEKVV